MSSTVRGQIAEILSIDQVAINRGSEQGVKKGMVFAVLDPEPRPITDPETGAHLGHIQRSKLKLRAVRVDANFCIAETFEEYEVNVGGRGGFGVDMSLFNPPRWEKRRRRIIGSDSDGIESSTADVEVDIGDPIVESYEEAAGAYPVPGPESTPQDK